MTGSEDPTDAIRRQALSYPDVTTGMSCSQSAFKVGKGSFLFIGPGPKGQGFKAMFKLKASMPEAHDLAEQEPRRYEVGSTGWVTRPVHRGAADAQAALGEVVVGVLRRDLRQATTKLTVGHALPLPLRTRRD